VAVEPHALPRRIEQHPPQCPPQELEPHLRLGRGIRFVTQSRARPARLDLADPFDHHFAVAPMRPAVQRQAHPHRGPLAAWQQQAVAAKIRKCPPLPLERAEHARKLMPDQHRARHQMMALHSRIMIRLAAPVD